MIFKFMNVRNTIVKCSIQFDKDIKTKIRNKNVTNLKYYLI